MSHAKQRRGLARVNPERRRQIAARGMKALRAKKKQHKFTSQEATEANAIRWGQEGTDGAKV